MSTTNTNATPATMAIETLEMIPLIFTEVWDSLEVGQVPFSFVKLNPDEVVIDIAGIQRVALAAKEGIDEPGAIDNALLTLAQDINRRLYGMCIDAGLLDVKEMAAINVWTFKCWVDGNSVAYTDARNLAKERVAVAVNQLAVLKPVSGE